MMKYSSHSSLHEIKSRSIASRSDGRVEACALISSRESSKITTSCWKVINRRMLEPSRKRYSMSKDKRPQWDILGIWLRGIITIKSNPLPARWVTKSGDQWYQRSSPTVVKVQNSTSGFPASGHNKGTDYPHGIWPWSPAGFDYKTSTGMGETETPGLEGTN